jgi:hypothetical protein
MMGRAIWAKIKATLSWTALAVTFPRPLLPGPGLGNELFSGAANYHGAPLTPILASPSARVM